MSVVVVCWITAIWLSLCSWKRAEAASGDASEGTHPRVILEAVKIDSSTVDVGLPAVVIYGLGYRDPVTDQWLRLTQARGVIQAVNSQRLLLAVAESGRSQHIDLARIETLILGATSLSPSRRRNTIQAQTEPVDSLTVQEMPPSWDIEDKGLRLLTKMATGAGSGIASAYIGWHVIGDVLRQTNVLGDVSYSDDGLEGLLSAFLSAAVGCSFGFPLGVTSVDPHDSGLKTLLYSGATFLGGMSLTMAGAILRLDTLAKAGFISSFVAPPAVSIAVSEKSRKSPQGRVSFSLLPTSNGGFSAVAKLCF